MHGRAGSTAAVLDDVLSFARKLRPVCHWHRQGTALFCGCCLWWVRGCAGSTAAVLDDVLSLVLMSEIGSLEASGPVSAWTYGAPVVGCVGSIIIGTVCAVLAGMHALALNLNMVGHC